jgi:hypothetical protein
MKMEIIFEDTDLSPQIYMENNKITKIIIEAPKININKVVNEGPNEDRLTQVTITGIHECPKCGELRPIEHYYYNHKGAYGIETYCILCRKEIQREKNKNRAKKKRRNRR